MPRDSTESAAQTPSIRPQVPAWLDEIGGRRALEWVRARNAQALARLDTPRFRRIEGQIREVLDDPRRIPYATARGGWAYNLWTDANHPRGLWRRQRLDAYVAGGERWDVLLDVDRLAADEGRSWVWHGARLLRPSLDRALVTLSEGGSDADQTREFDLATRSFVRGGLARPTSKGDLSWIDRDRAWLLHDFGPGSVSSSGYPLQARVLRRGQRPEQAALVMSAGPDDMAIWAAHDSTPGFARSTITVSHDFYHSTTYLLGARAERSGRAPARIDVPSSADVGLWREWLLVSLHEDMDEDGRRYPAGALLAAPLDAFQRGERRLTVLFAPDAHRVLYALATTRHHLLVTSLEDVITHVSVLTPPAGGRGEWSRVPLDVAQSDVGPLATVSASALDAQSEDRVWLTASGFTEPASLRLMDLGPGGAVRRTTLVRRAPALFDASGVRLAQHFALSPDGTRVPYFEVAGRGSAGGRTPTLLYGYGGFEVCELPGYSATVGRAWLERGGTWVLANIRGGGEYGPAWHQAALARHRHRAYEDFAAVARDLLRRGVSDSAHLGTQGGSNGGLLVGNMLTQYPDLFGAVVCQAPLLDMRRYHRLLAGASWEAEYGDPDDPAQWEFIRGFSPFHLFDPRRDYPPVLFTTSTRDDRVHPAHARTMAWQMLAAGKDVTFYENVEGGHAGAADNHQRARMQALAWEFLWQRLG